MISGGKGKFAKALIQANKKYKIYAPSKNQMNILSQSSISKYMSKKKIDSAYKKISSWEGYNSTPLLNLNKLNNKLKLGNIFYKDESKRFHLKSFKALGGAYAVEQVSKGKKNITISSATAGNHGRSVAWGAQRLGLKCKIFISQHVSKAREIEIKKFGADVIRVKGDYASSLRECKKLTKKHKWKIVQDVSDKNYKLVPKLTMAGYSIMIKEISKQTAAKIQEQLYQFSGFYLQERTCCSHL